MYNLIAPLHIQQSKKKKFLIGLNPYRNTHYQILNKIKVNYKEEMKSQILTLPLLNRIELIYTLYPRTKHLCDISNILSIHDKFLCDALVEFGKLPEDNYLFVPKVTYLFGNVDKENPRVEIQLIQLKETNDGHLIK